MSSANGCIINILFLLFRRYNTTWCVYFVGVFQHIALFIVQPVNKKIKEGKELYHPGCLPLTKLQLSQPEEQRNHSFEWIAREEVYTFPV